MKPAFWTNTIWYILLGIVSVLAIIFIFCKSNNKKFSFAFLWVVLGLAYFVETYLLVAYGGAYEYYPKLAKDSYIETAIGNQFSQVSISTSIMLLIIYKLPLIWVFIVSAAYFLIELLFLKLGIYVQNWYRTWYTFVGIIGFYFIVKKWYYKILDSPKHWFYYVTLYLGVFSLHGNLLTIPIYTGIRVIHYNIFPNFFKDQLVNIHIQSILLINIMILLYKSKLSRTTKGLIFILLAGIEYILSLTGIVYVAPGYFLVVAAIDLVGCYLCVAVMDYLLSKGPLLKKV